LQAGFISLEAELFISVTQTFCSGCL